jgi:hypothetical protein
MEILHAKWVLDFTRSVFSLWRLESLMSGYRTLTQYSHLPPLVVTLLPTKLSFVSRQGLEIKRRFCIHFDKVAVTLSSMSSSHETPSLEFGLTSLGAFFVACRTGQLVRQCQEYNNCFCCVLPHSALPFRVPPDSVGHSDVHPLGVRRSHLLDIHHSII